MTQPVRYDRTGGIATVTIANPPVNALGHAVRLGLRAAFATFAADDAARIAIILGAGRLFIGGADIAEFGKPLAEPGLPEVIDAIEAQTKPVVAAIQGAALGGGLEVAMGAHYRLALPGATLGLPEVKLGVIPGAGGTQRGPRLMGLRTALEIIPAGGTLDAEAALAAGLIDRLGSGDDARAAGLAYAQDLLDQGAGPRPTGQLPRPAMDAALFEQSRALWARKAWGEVAPLAAIDAVEAATQQGIRPGLAAERRIFARMMDTPQRAGLIHAFFNDRKVARLPELEGIAARKVRAIGVVGGGTMGAGIATAALLSRLPVVLVERDAAAAKRARAAIADMLAAAVTRGKLAAAARAALLAEALTTATDIAALAEADLIVEAVFEDMNAKRAVFADLDRVAKPGAVLATNTSYLDINAIADATARPADVIGLHFFSPAHVMKLLEVVVADRTAPEVTATAFALAKRLGKIAVRAGVCDGFIGNRILGQTRAAADRMVLAGASPFEVDAALRSFGFAMGPHEVIDLAGLDIGFRTRARLAPDRDPRDVVPVWADALYHMGRLGRKTGRGYYIHDGGKAVPDPEVDELVAAARADAGITPRAFDPDGIARRYMAAMVNEAARVIQEGIAARPLDVDVTLLYGYGFPRWRGGPMHWADTEGLQRIRDDIVQFAREDDHFWQPAPLLQRLVRENRTFASLNG